MENERQPAGRRGLDDEHNSIELARGTNHEAINATVSMITRITTLFFFILLGCVYGFRFKRPPQLSSPLCWKDAHIFIGQHSTHRDTRCYAFDENDGRGRGSGRDGTGGRGRERGTSNGRGYAGVNGGETNAVMHYFSLIAIMTTQLKEKWMLTFSVNPIQAQIKS